MEHKILFIAKKSTLTDKYAASIAGKYELEQRSISVKSLYRELVNVSVILLYATAYDPEEIDELYSFLTIMPNSYIPVVLFGTPSDIKSMKNTLRYPIAAELDASKRPFRLEEELGYLLRKFYPVKKDSATQIAKKRIIVYNTQPNILQRLKNLLEETYNVSVTDSKRAMFADMGKSKPDLLIIGFDNAAPANTEFLLTQLSQTEAVRHIPVMIYGDYMSNEQKERFQAYKVKGIMADSDDVALAKATIDQFLAKKISGDDIFKLI